VRIELNYEIYDGYKHLHIFDEEASECNSGIYGEKKPGDSYGRIRTELKRKALLIGELDMLIAAHAKSLKLILATNNTGEFSRVSGLTIEDWK